MEASKGVLLTPKIYRVISKRAKEIIGLLTLAIFLTLIETQIPSSVSIFLNRRYYYSSCCVVAMQYSVPYDILHILIYTGMYFYDVHTVLTVY